MNLNEELNRQKSLMGVPQSDETIQMYVDIIDNLDTSDPKRQQYIDTLRNKYSYNYQEPDDESFIQNIDLNNIKYKDDFRNFDNYKKYAKRLVVLRGMQLEPIYHKDIIFTIKDVEKIGLILGFEVKYTPYYNDTSDNYASANSGRITMPEEVGAGILIHEMGHVYDGKFNINGISKIITNSPTLYGANNAGETFAENFKFYFLHPQLLKDKLPEVYSELDHIIIPKWKLLIQSLL